MSEPLRVCAAVSLRPAFEDLAVASQDGALITYAKARDLARRITDGERRRRVRLGERGASASAACRGPRPHVACVCIQPARRRGPSRQPGGRCQRARAAGIRLVTEVAGIPLGDYTGVLLARLDRQLGAGFAQRALANVVMEEQLVDDVASRLLTGDADAAVLYGTDFAARSGRLRAIKPPAGAQVAATYVACATTATIDAARATAWVDALSAPATVAIMRRAGFGLARLAERLFADGGG